MAETSNIEWCDATWNCWYGCRKVSSGCDHCYMFRDMPRFGRDPSVVTRSKTTFYDPLKWVKSGKLKPESKIFVCSWSDFFIEEADDWRDEAWDIMRQTPEFNYLILTKRPENIQDRLPISWSIDDRYSHLWLGVTAENQEQADKRIPILLQIPAAKRFVSIEPMLGEIDLTRLNVSHLPHHKGYVANVLDHRINSALGKPYKHIDWVILGAESGPKRRRCETVWIESVVNQCKEAGVPAFVKQLHIGTQVSKDVAEWPHNLQLRQHPAEGRG